MYQNTIETAVLFTLMNANELLQTSKQFVKLQADAVIQIWVSF